MPLNWQKTEKLVLVSKSWNLNVNGIKRTTNCFVSQCGSDLSFQNLIPKSLPKYFLQNTVETCKTLIPSDISFKWIGFQDHCKFCLFDCFPTDRFTIPYCFPTLACHMPFPINALRREKKTNTNSPSQQKKVHVHTHHMFLPHLSTCLFPWVTQAFAIYHLKVPADYRTVRSRF